MPLFALILLILFGLVVLTGVILSAIEKLVRQGWARPEERIVLFNTGSGLKYLDHFR